MTECLLSDEEIRKLNRDLRILITTDGTLTRMLNIVANDEIVVQIINQQILNGEAVNMPDVEQLPSGRILRRNILLKGRSSGSPLVAAESLIAIDLLPLTVTTGLTTTEDPIGEVIAASCLETFKEEAKVWIRELPDWVVLAGYKSSQPRTVARRYRIITGGQPVLIITEYFLRNEFEDAP